MPYAEVNGERLYYEVEGEGPPLVLVRGLGRSMRYWAPLLEALGGRFRVLSYDHRGIGRSEISGRGFLLPDLARDLSALMEAADMPRAHVLGLSLGGMVAQHLALDFPARVDRLVLGGTWCGGPKSRFPNLRVLLGLTVASRLPPRWGARMMAPRLVSRAYLKAHAQIPAEWAEIMAMEPLDRQVVMRQALGGALHDTSSRLGQLRAPTLIITGDADRLVHPLNSEVLREAIPDARLEVLPGVGHELTSEAPREIAALLDEFLGEDRAPEKSVDQERPSKRNAVNQ